VPTLGDLYRAGRERVTDLVSPLGRSEAARVVPACPAWSVKDVVAHLAGICDDIVAGRLDGVATEAWTAAQVAARHERTLTEVLAEWERLAPQVEAAIDQFGRSGEQLLTDLVTHEHDLRHALGRPGAQDCPGIHLAARFVVEVGMERAFADAGVGPVEVRAGERTWLVAGEGDPTVTLTTTPFEVVRAFTGRRSDAQISAMGWSDDPAPYVAAFRSELFTPSAVDFDE
jgi:uncharacterized protein (TIGR03083 family)